MDPFTVLLCNNNYLALVICLHPFKWIDIQFVREKFIGNFFLNELKLICLLTDIAVDSTLLNGFNYYISTQLILFNIIHLFVWLVGFYGISNCRLFNAKSIFIQTVSSISNNSV